MDGFRYKMEKRIFGISNFFHEYVVFEVQGFVEASHAIHLGLSLNIYETSYMSIVVNHLFPNAEFVVVPLHSNRQTKFFNIKQFNGRNVIRKPTWKNNLTHDTQYLYVFFYWIQSYSTISVYIKSTYSCAQFGTGKACETETAHSTATVFRSSVETKIYI